MQDRKDEASMSNLNIWSQFYEWEIKDYSQRRGISFSDSSLFLLPNGAIRCPDAAWVRSESLWQIYGDRWEDITERQKENIHPLAPDVVVECRYFGEDLTYLQWKMQEYIANGSSLGWLIEVETQKVEIYRHGHKVEKIQSAQTLSGEYVMPGFKLNIQKILMQD